MQHCQATHMTQRIDIDNMHACMQQGKDKWLLPWHYLGHDLACSQEHRCLQLGSPVVCSTPWDPSP